MRLIPVRRTRASRGRERCVSPLGFREGRTGRGQFPLARDLHGPGQLPARLPGLPRGCRAADSFARSDASLGAYWHALRAARSTSSPCCFSMQVTAQFGLAKFDLHQCFCKIVAQIGKRSRDSLRSAVRCYRFGVAVCIRQREAPREPRGCPRFACGRIGRLSDSAVGCSDDELEGKVCARDAARRETRSAFFVLFWNRRFKCARRMT